MTRALDLFCLAVDGGGTRCRIALSDGTKIRQIEVGAANVSTDFNAACAEITRGLNTVAAQAGLSAGDLTHVPAYLGLAGITGNALADQLAVKLPFRWVRITDDRAQALRGALGAGDGLVAHCGTGSFIAAQIAGRAQFAGGWGPVLGDQASAQWVGRLALTKTLESIDGTSPQSAMTEDLSEQYGGAAGIVQAAADMSPTAFGALAPVVTARAEEGDDVAGSILQAGAEYLSDRMRSLGWRPGMSICLTGGIGPLYAPYLPADMQPHLAKPLGDPMAGALALAQAFQKEIENERC